MNKSQKLNLVQQMNEPEERMYYPPTSAFKQPRRRGPCHSFERTDTTQRRIDAAQRRRKPK